MIYDDRWLDVRSSSESFHPSTDRTSGYTFRTHSVLSFFFSYTGSTCSDLEDVSFFSFHFKNQHEVFVHELLGLAAARDRVAYKNAFPIEITIFKAQWESKYSSSESNCMWGKTHYQFHNPSRLMSFPPATKYVVTVLQQLLSSCVDRGSQ